MAKGGTEVLFSRGSQDGDSTADDWDDTELLKEYDRAVRPLKALVAERMGLSNAEIEEVSATESGSSKLDKDGGKGSKRRKRRRKAKSRQQREWAAGDHCQAKYTLDEKWYEATVVSINHDRGTCTVQYVGYGNSEDQPLSALSLSLGAAIRRQQGLAAAAKRESDATQSDDLMERSSEASSTISLSKVVLDDSNGKSNNTEKLGNSSHFPQPQIPGLPNIPRPQVPGLSNFPRPQIPGLSGGGRPSIPNHAGLAAHSAMNDMIPPPLPPHVLASLPGDDSEALSAMLMSWYMSGFHTGYYQGLKRAKNFNQS